MPAPPRKTSSSSPGNKPRMLRGQLWVECNGKFALTEAGADLLDQIAACGSLSGAARRLGFSYRRAWMLLDSMNQRWPAPLVLTATGGQGGGGATLTDAGRHVLRTFRDVQLQMEHLLNTVGDPFEPLP